MAIGVPWEDIGGVVDAGAVSTLCGGLTGLTEVAHQFWHQDVAGVREDADFGDRFGAALVAGKFNGDRFADLSLGVPGEDISGDENAGAGLQRLVGLQGADE